jgi:DNA helicase-2/ATP-dependent DNA helicase PcrA
MSRRLAAPDTDADVQLREIIDRARLTNFVMTAGAGSGKTTSLVKALAHVVDVHGPRLRMRTQRVACITYTEVAAHEIHEDVGNNPLVLVSTIHSFLWSLARPFQRDIAEWVAARVEEKIQDRLDKQSKHTARTSPAIKEKIAADLNKFKQQQAALSGLDRFTYGIGSDYGQGIVGHDDVLKMVPQLIMEKPLLVKIAAQRFPYIFVDESQDTFESVVECLQHISSVAPGTVCLGFFGDPMQQIYQQGTGSISFPTGWCEVEKPENFRCSKRVLAVVNNVRAAGDGLLQVSGQPAEKAVDGESFFFVLPADDQRTRHLEVAREWLDAHSVAGRWTGDAAVTGAKILMIVHRMAAKRLGFESLYAAFNDNGSSNLKQAFDEGTAWPVRPFQDVIMPLCTAEASGDASVVAVLRRHSPVLTGQLAPSAVRATIASANVAVEDIRERVAAGGAGSVGAVLRLAVDAGLVEQDARLAAYLRPEGEHGDVVLSESTLKTLDGFVACDVAEIAGYFRYIGAGSPYSTQHGTKGSEFDRVIVVLDDDEGTFNLYSYEKLFGIAPLSSKDQANAAAGADSVIERTRRLLYVCVSRAKTALAVVLFAHDVLPARDALERSGITGGERVLTLADL